MMRRLSAAFFVFLWLAGAALAQGIIPLPSNNVAIAGTVAARTRIIAVPTSGTGVSRQIVVTAMYLVPVATSVVTFSYGTGTDCGTGTVALPALTFAAGQTVNIGSGLGPVLILPSGNDLCITIATAVAPGNLVYTILP